MKAATPVAACELPAHSLLGKYRASGYADCYSAEITPPVSHAEYVEVFYTTKPFKLERLLLRWLVSRPSTDAQARELAAGSLDRFAAWTVEARAADQLLLCDFHGRTRSWLMSEPLANGEGTRLYFGSAVVPSVDRATGKARMGFVFGALLGFHKIYSQVLLRAAVARLAERGRS